MKTLIVYCSSHGTTEKAVQLLKEELKGEVLSLDLNNEKPLESLYDFDTIIIGGSIHAGSIQRKIKHFIEKNHDVLRDKEIGLFLCCMMEGDKAVEEFNNAFPQDLRKNSTAMGLFGGEFLFSKMNFFERQIVKRVSGVSTDQYHLDVGAIKEFASLINHIKVPA